METIYELRQLLQDLIASDVRSIDARLTALDKKVDANHLETMTALNRIKMPATCQDVLRASKAS